MYEHTIMRPFKPLRSYTFNAVKLRGLIILKDLVWQFNGGRGPR